MSCRGSMAAQRSNPPLSLPPRFQSDVSHRRCSVIIPVRRDNPSIFPNLKLISPGQRQSRWIGLICHATDDSDEHEFSAVLDAFFLGKALADALTERIDSTLGEFIREQQKQIQAFQEDVLDRARRAKRLALLEIKVAQGLINSTSIGANVVNDVTDAASSVTGFVVTEAGTVLPKGVSVPKDVAETGTLVAGSIVSDGVSAAEGIAKTGTSVVGSAISAVPKGASAANDIPKMGTSIAGSVVSEASSAVPKGASAAEDIAKAGTSVVGSVISAMPKGASAADNFAKTGTSIASSVVSEASSAGPKGVSAAEDIAKAGTSVTRSVVSSAVPGAGVVVKTGTSVADSVISAAESAVVEGVSAVEGVAKTGTSAADAAISKGAKAAKGAVKTTGSVISKVLKHSDDDPFFGLINKG